MVLETSRLVPVWRAVARHPLVLDTLLGVVIAAGYLAAVRTGPQEAIGRPLNRTDIVVAVLAVVFVAVRRRWPLPVLAAASVAAAASFDAVDHMIPVLATVTAVCAYTVASVSTRFLGWASGFGAAAFLYICASLRGGGWFAPESVGMVAWIGMAVAVGDALRTRRAYVAAVEERARRAEQSRDEEARRRVVEERLRIARELHDVVAHHIAMINVQAGVAAHVLRRQPDKAEEALGHVRQAARTVLEELSTVLGVLRRSDEGDPAAEPTRGLDRLAGLLDALAAAGFRVEHRQEGTARPLPASVDLAAYRIVQESLTNAQKHGNGAAARLRLAYAADGLSITVTNAATPTPTNGAGTGHGLLGMRERADAVGGTLDVGPDRYGDFTVQAFLPSPERPEVPA